MENGQAERGAPLFLKEVMDAAQAMRHAGWAERNAGNMSRLVSSEEAAGLIDAAATGKKMALPLAAPDLAGWFMLITGTGSWFAHVCREPERTLGLVRVAPDGASVDLLWGFAGTDGPTSELPSHILGHRARLKADPDHRVIIHTHPISLIALSAVLPPGDRPFTRALWKMHSECLPVFPDGVGVIPWMVPGTVELGEVTAEKLADRRLVVWPLHGVVGTGRTVDEALGIIEAAEKGADVYLRVRSAGRIRLCISDAQLLQSAQRFGLTPRPGMIGKS